MDSQSHDLTNQDHFQCPEACPFKPASMRELLEQARTLADDKEVLEKERAKLIAQRAELRRIGDWIDKGWSYLFALFMTLMAPLVFIKSANFAGFLPSNLETREVNPLAFLVYFGLIGASIGLPTEQFVIAFGKILSSDKLAEVAKVVVQAKTPDRSRES